MRLLIVGSFLEYGIDVYYYRYIKQYFKTVNLFPAQDIFNNYYYKNIINKILCRLGYQYIYNVINKSLKLEIEKLNPDIILVFKGMELQVNTLKWINSKKILIANYNADHPFYYHGSGSGNKNVSKGLPYYNMHVSYSYTIINQIQIKYPSIATRILPFGYEMENKIYEAIEHEKEILESCFIGTPDKGRKKMIEYLLGNGIKITVVGYNWEKFLAKHPLLTIKPQALNQDLWKVIRQYRIQINIFRPHNEGSHNMRSFEIPAAGGLQLAPYSKEHELYFEINKEIFLYSSKEDLVKKINQLLLLSADEINKIRIAARKKSIEAGYSYAERAKQLANFLLEVKVEK